MSAWSTISSVFGKEEKPVQAGMAFWDAATGQELTSSLRAFQYFPEKVQDSKGAEYAQKTIPGGSHPIYTFISGGERSISLEAIFTNENPKDLDPTNPYSVKISDAISWLRTAIYPCIDRGVSRAPPLVVLYLPGSFINPTTNDGKIVGILTQVNVVYEAFHRDGTPRIATVALEIKEVVQTRPNWRFISGEDGFNDQESISALYEQPFYKKPFSKV